MNKRQTGIKGEEMVAAYLRKTGYIIVKRNYRCRFGEIDIVAEHGEYIVFIEVKTRDENYLVGGLESVNAAKQRRILMTAEHFLSRFDRELQPRFDVAEVIIQKLSDGRNSYKLNYLKNAF